MARNTEKTVTISLEFHYDLDARSRRTLPVGWQGPVPADVAKRIKDAGAGVVVGDLAKAKIWAAKRGVDPAAAAQKAEEEAAAKKAEEEAAAVAAAAETPPTA